MRGLNSANKQFKVAHTLTTHNIGLFSLLETKIKRSGLGPLYRRLCYNWCLTSNLPWHKGGRIIVGCKLEFLKVNICLYSSQLIHLFAIPIMGVPFFCRFVYGASYRNDRLELFCQLESISKHIDKPWIALGDFNCIANFNERIGQAVRL